MIRLSKSREVAANIKVSPLITVSRESKADERVASCRTTIVKLNIRSSSLFNRSRKAGGDDGDTSGSCRYQQALQTSRRSDLYILDGRVFRRVAPRRVSGCRVLVGGNMQKNFVSGIRDGHRSDGDCNGSAQDWPGRSVSHSASGPARRRPSRRPLPVCW